MEQETVIGSGISWAVCKSAPRSRQITTPAPHHSVFTGRMPFLLPNQQRQSTEGTCAVVTAGSSRSYKKWCSVQPEPGSATQAVLCWCPVTVMRISRVSMPVCSSTSPRPTPTAACRRLQRQTPWIVLCRSLRAPFALTAVSETGRWRGAPSAKSGKTECSPAASSCTGMLTLLLHGAAE